MKTCITAILFLLLVTACSNDPFTPSMSSVISKAEAINGNPNYLQSPFLTAGNRFYLVGHQDGSFPELGWHIPGEMGGLWNHPMKMLDGFDVRISANNTNTRLINASSFTNYPFANAHTFELTDQQLNIVRRQFIPDDTEGLVLEYTINNTASKPVNFQLEFSVNSDIRPTWLGERTGLKDGSDIAEIDKAKNIIFINDSIASSSVAITSSLSPVKQVISESTHPGKSTSVSSVFELELEGEEQLSLRFFIAGSLRSQIEAENTLISLSNNWPALLNQKKMRYNDLEATSKLTIPDKELEQAFRWLKYNCDWLVRTVPGVGTGIGAGIPDYPWWFGVDSEYALQGYMMIGQRETVYKTIQLLDSISEAINGNGRIVHEVSTNGAVFNEGNINETPQFATLIRRIYDWSADETFARSYFPTIKKGLHWLETATDKDGNGFPDGFGMMEIHGLDSEMIDVAVYTQQAYTDAAYLAEVLGESDLAEEYNLKAGLLKESINERFWSEDFESYADFIGTDEQALRLIEDAIVRADTLNKPWAIEELEQTRKMIQNNPADHSRPFVLHHNWVVNTPMETGIAPEEKAIKALNTAKKFVNPFGVFVTGIDRDESAGSDSSSFKGSKVFSYTGAVMTLPTGVQAISENNYGRPDEALDYLKRMTRSFSYAFPGSIYEVSPDYGMMTQAWTIYSYAVPIISQFFGLSPEAATNTLVLSPQMPSSWPEARLENVPVADGTITMSYKKENGMMSYTAEHDLNSWNFKIILPKKRYLQPTFNEDKISLSENDSQWILETERKKLTFSASLREPTE